MDRQRLWKRLVQCGLWGATGYVAAQSFQVVPTGHLGFLRSSKLLNSSEKPKPKPPGLYFLGFGPRLYLLKSRVLDRDFVITCESKDHHRVSLGLSLTAAIQHEHVETFMALEESKKKPAVSVQHQLMYVTARDASQCVLSNLTLAELNQDVDETTLTRVLREEVEAQAPKLLLDVQDVKVQSLEFSNESNRRLGLLNEDELEDLLAQASLTHSRAGQKQQHIV